MRKITSILLAFVLALTLVPTAWAEETLKTEAGNENTYLIQSEKDLQLFAATVTNDDDAYAGKTIKLTTDIDLGGASWTPIVMTGTGADDGNQRVTFDGQGHTISNFTVTAAEGEHNTGLFGTANFSIIRNLNVDNATVTGYNHVGAIVGHGMVTTISGCKVTNSNITTAVYNNDDGDKAGAVVGWVNEGICNITNCTVEGCTITGYRDIAGLVGFYGTTGGVGTVTGNTVKNTVIIQNTDNGYEETVPTTVKEIVGRSGSSFTLDTSKNVAIDTTVNQVTKIGEDGKATEEKTTNVSKTDDSTATVETVKTTENGKTSTTVTKTVTNTGNNLIAKTEAEVTEAKVTAASTVSTETAASVIRNESKNKSVTLDATVKEATTATVTKTEITVPAETANLLGNNAGKEAVKTMTIKTDVANLTIDSEALGTLTTAAKETGLKLVLEQTDATVTASNNVTATYELTALVGDEPVFRAENASTNGTITVSVPYEKTADSTLTVYYVNGSTKTNMNATYDAEAGELAWTTNHFSTYEIVETVPVSSSTGRHYSAVLANKAADTTTEAKSSPKTFDAGVGIYAVSAVLSVTGMAWVGRKKF